MSEAQCISVILPIFNEEAGLPIMLGAIRSALEETGNAYEIICVDDGSSDASAKVIQALAQEDPRIKPIALARNFGKESAMAAGLAAAMGNAVVLMDSDMQHPPDLIKEMIGLWRSGYDVVHAKKRTRGSETFTYRMLAKAFNYLMGEAAGFDFRGSSDFKLLDRAVVDALNHLPEKNRFFRGLVSWLGFRSIEIEFDVQSRVAGDTKWTATQLVRYSLRNLLAFSSFPLRAVAATGFFSLIFTGILSCWTLYRYLRGDALSGFTTVILLQLVLGSMLLAGVGVIALYLSEAYRELKARPVFILGRDARREYKDAISSGDSGRAIR